MAYTITEQDALKMLKEAGYKPQLDFGIITVFGGPALGDRIYPKNGMVSDRAVTVLLNKMKKYET